MRWKVYCFVAAMCLSVICGCQGDGSHGSLYHVTGEDPAILVHNLEGGMEAQILGILTYDSNSKCLFLKSIDANEPGLVTPVWPSGTTPHIDNNRRGVEIPGYGTILEGEKIDASGGEIERSELAGLKVPSGCLDTNGIVAISDI